MLLMLSVYVHFSIDRLILFNLSCWFVPRLSKAMYETLPALWPVNPDRKSWTGSSALLSGGSRYFTSAYQCVCAVSGIAEISIRFSGSNLESATQHFKGKGEFSEEEQHVLLRMKYSVTFKISFTYHWPIQTIVKIYPSKRFGS